MVVEGCEGRGSEYSKLVERREGTGTGSYRGVGPVGRIRRSRERKDWWWIVLVKLVYVSSKTCVRACNDVESGP